MYYRGRIKLRKISNRQNYRHATPLALAVEYGHEAVVRLLLETGEADVTLRDDHNYTPLSTAAMTGQEAIVGLLLETGETDVNSTGCHGGTPLWYATSFGDEAIVRLLLDAGQANLDGQDTGWTDDKP